ncbi:TetR/AcrR family transcriptional regulator [Proteiniphilum sp.]|uniref:TetR/AcrR family transcriptional regulator n=1 Tax=Proteiniphilum sp. TaxID=1926877 RepID=UPI002B1F14DC|nr:TetR family transcriptional regulator [Proteiniphilum sp.]MEA4916910.1 TetR family transcriptional regulator [Proteiniphilum sp.]
MARRYSTSDVSDRILNAARELFIANGYEGTSIRDIAAASGANVAHVKYYFNSKANLFEIIFDEAFEILVKRVFATLSSDMPFFEIVENWINTYYEMLPKYPQIPMFILNEINHGPDALADKLIKKNPQKIFNKLAEKMEEEIAKGTIKNIPVIDFGLDILSLCLFPFIFGGFATRIAKKSGAEYNTILKEHKQHVIDFVKSALRP